LATLNLLLKQFYNNCRTTEVPGGFLLLSSTRLLAANVDKPPDHSKMLLAGRKPIIW